ncbi:enoyl-CoA hydratase/isomerase family protein [Bacillus sp. 2205SS5-2]|uniref:enoyl-CoA hydratase/isomerase family protein n=1 Tax=Bacillus sp. 2205SS5-2 TaxID=3109031 RepID=UPI003006D44E
MFESIKYEVRNAVAWITLNRPTKLNAFTELLNKEVTKAIKESSKSADVRCIVISGEGRAFCSGEDLSGVNEEMNHGDVLRNRYAPMMRELASCEKPIVAGINGVAAGAGLSLALACDFRLMNEKASLVQAFIHVGLIPDSGNLYYLPRLIGHAKALELSVMGDKISAQEAKNLGLVTRVVEGEQWQEELTAFAEAIANKPTKAIGLIKRSLRQSWHSDFNEYLEKEAQGQRIAGLTKDHREGVHAFIEKRKSNFSGK